MRFAYSVLKNLADLMKVSQPIPRTIDLSLLYNILYQVFLRGFQEVIQIIPIRRMLSCAAYVERHSCRCQIKSIGGKLASLT